MPDDEINPDSEALVRQVIDAKLVKAGWVQDPDELNVAATLIQQPGTSKTYTTVPAVYQVNGARLDL